jgi:hypothetical protein
VEIRGEGGQLFALGEQAAPPVGVPVGGVEQFNQLQLGLERLLFLRDLRAQ